jgi:SAM-dependent methyltransferase
LIYADPRADRDDAKRHYESVEDRGSGSLAAATDSTVWRRAVSERRRHLELALPHLQGASMPRFLEIGFGDASALAASSELGWEPHGLEYANWLVQSARRRLALDNIQAGGLEEAGLETASFDVVYAWHVIEHVLDVRGWLSEVARILRPGGILVLGTESAESVYGILWRGAFRLLGRPPWPPTSTDHTYWFRDVDIRRLLAEAGFDATQIDVYENPPHTVARLVTWTAMRNPRAALALLLYLATSVTATVAPHLGGKLIAVARRS